MLRTLAAVLIVLHGTAAFGQALATLSSGKQVRGGLTAGPTGLVFRSEDGKTQVPAALVREIQYQPSQSVLSTTAPWRRIGFPGGDAIAAEVVDWDGDKLRLKLRTGDEVSVPRSGLSLLELPEGQELLLHEDFGSEREELPAGLEPHSLPAALPLASGAEKRWTLPRPLREGLIQVWFTGDAPAVDSLTFELLGGSPAKSRVRVRMGDLANGSAPMKLPAGWHCLGLWSLGGSLRVTLDGSVVAEGGELSGVSDVRVARDNSAGAMAIDDLLALRFDLAQGTPVPSRSGTQDVVQLLAGEQFFGRLVELDRNRIALKTSLATERWTWRDVRRVMPVPATAAGDRTAGLQCRIEMSALFGVHPASVDVLHAAVTGLQGENLDVQHPWLGRLAVPVASVSRIVPEFAGDCWPVDFGTHHLGNEVRADFDLPRPEGPRLRTWWTAKELPAGEISVSFLVRDLEPGGPQTPSSGRYSDELKEGGLITELVVNGQPAAIVNRFVNLRSERGPALRVRIPVPRRFWKPGQNSVELIQRPLRSDPESFDDVEISRIAVDATGK